MDDMYYVLISYDGTWSSLKQHETQAKTQYQYVESSMDDRDRFDMMVHGHHWNNIWPKPRPNTSMSNLVWMIGIGLIWSSMVITETTYDIIMKNTWSRPMPNTNMRDEYGGMLWYDGAWSVIMKS